MLLKTLTPARSALSSRALPLPSCAQTTHSAVLLCPVQEMLQRAVEPLETAAAREFH